MSAIYDNRERLRDLQTSIFTAIVILFHGNLCMDINFSFSKSGLCVLTSFVLFNCLYFILLPSSSLF